MDEPALSGRGASTTNGDGTAVTSAARSRAQHQLTARSYPSLAGTGAQITWDRPSVADPGCQSTRATRSRGARFDRNIA